MKKFIIASALMLLATANANASLSFFDDITADQLAGAEVTVTYESGVIESGLLEDVGSQTAEVVGTDFSLSVDGATFAQFETLEGFWNFQSSSFVSSIVIDLLSIGAVFDPVAIAGDASGPGGAGLNFIATSAIGNAPLAGIIGTFSNPVIAGDLYSTLTITAVDAPLLESFIFAVDTDLVPTPAVFSLIMLVLGGLVVRRMKA